jgi:multiple sugar transport system permease protein
MARKYTPYLYVLPVVVILFALNIYPLIYSLVLTFQTWVLSSEAPAVFVGLENYQTLLVGSEAPYFWNAIKTNFIFSFGVVAVEFVLGLGLALLIKGVRGESVFRVIWVIPMLLTPLAVGMLFYYMFIPSEGIIPYVFDSMITPTLGITLPPLLNSIPWALLSMMVIDIWQWTPFMFLSILAAMKALPSEPFEAAQVDGASKVQVFTRITISYLKPIFIVILLLRMVDAMKVFDIIFATTGGGPGGYTEVVSIYTYFTAWRRMDMGLATTTSWIFAIIVTIFAQLLIRYMRYEEA